MPLSLVVDIFNENDCYILKHVQKTLKFITIFNFFKGYSCRYYYNRNIKATQDLASCSTHEIPLDEFVYPIRDNLTDSGVQTEISLPLKWFV